MYGPSTGHRVPGRNSGSPDASARACSCQSATLARSASARPCLRDCVGDFLRVAAGQGVPAGIPRGVQRRTADPPDTQDHRHVLAFGDRRDHLVAAGAGADQAAADAGQDTVLASRPDLADQLPGLTQQPIADRHLDPYGSAVTAQDQHAPRQGRGGCGRAAAAASKTPAPAGQDGWEPGET
jgi:hypothetical protein